MPAIITHDTFGHETYDELQDFIGSSEDEKDAFILGNQGPDPLFYSVVSPRLRAVHKLGGRMHHERPSELLLAFKQSLDVLEDNEREIGRAYILGFLCHYLLDSTMHPFVYWQEYSLCDAGVEGLDRNDGNEVHAVIESELDELVLFEKRHLTVADFDTAREILKASIHTLDVISKMYVYVAENLFELSIPKDTFRASVLRFRGVQALFHSKDGVKRELISRAEERVRRHSFYRAMSHRAVELKLSDFDNHEHKTWENPFTQEKTSDSFWDRYEAARKRTQNELEVFAGTDFDIEAAEGITHGLDFSGEPVYARIVAVEEAEAETDAD